MTARAHSLAAALAAAAVTLLALAPAALAVSAAEREFIWNEANARMAAAASPRDFLRAAESYQKLVDLNVRNGSLFYNLGTALLNAERYAEAIDAFARAERYGGSRPDIARNLQVAHARMEKVRELSPTWDRVVLFWHYGLSCATRARVAALAFLALWVGLTLRRIGRRHAARAVIAIALIALVLFGSSVANSLHRESNAQRPLLGAAGP
jgi:tetratricopeptide (TPR) repeat protein